MSQIILPDYITQGKRKLRLRVETTAASGGEEKVSVVDLETNEALIGVKSIHVNWSNHGTPTALVEMLIEDIEVSVLSGADIEE